MCQIRKRPQIATRESLEVERVLAPLKEAVSSKQPDYTVFLPANGDFNQEKFSI